MTKRSRGRKIRGCFLLCEMISDFSPSYLKVGVFLFRMHLSEE